MRIFSDNKAKHSVYHNGKYVGGQIENNGYHGISVGSGSTVQSGHIVLGNRQSASSTTTDHNWDFIGEMKDVYLWVSKPKQQEFAKELYEQQRTVTRDLS